MKTDNPARRMIWGRRLRKSASGLHAIFSILLLAMLWIMVNHLSFRHYRREDWSVQQLSVLAPETLAMLEALDRPVRLVMHVSREALGRDMLEDLLKEYERHSRRVRLEIIDPDRDIGATMELQGRYDLLRGDSLLLISRDQHVVLDLNDMLEMESDETRRLGDAARLVGFRGESLITSALIRMARDQRETVYFLSGHGEMDVDLFDRSPLAFSDARERLEREGIDARVLRMDEHADVPADAAAVVIAGPSARIPQPELDVLRRYLQRGGRMMVMLNPLRDGGLAPLLEEWGIHLLPDVVVDPGATFTGQDVHVTQYGSHPITRGMDGVRTVFIRPRSVLPVAFNAPADRPGYSVLAASSSGSWAELDLTEDPIRFNPDVDQRGPIPLAAAIELPASSANGRDVRLVVAGDTQFAGNWLRSGGGMLFFRNSVNWLLDRDSGITLPSAPVDVLRVHMDQKQLTRLFLLVAGLMPGAAALLGILVAWRRRT